MKPGSGSVTRDGPSGMVKSEVGDTRFRETYQVTDPHHFTYRAQSSRDGGHSWDPVSIEISMTKNE